MNKIYKVVFNVSLGVYQVVSEWVKGRGKSSSGCQSGVVGGVYSAVPRGSRLATLSAMVMLAMGVMVAVPANASGNGDDVATALKVQSNGKGQIGNKLKQAGITGPVNLCYFADSPYSSVFCSNNIQGIHDGLNNSVYLGKNLQAEGKGTEAVVIGENAYGTATHVVSLGKYTKATADSATAVGAKAQALASHSVALGGDQSTGAKVDEGADYSLAVMAGAKVNGNKKNGIAIGQGATIGVEGQDDKEVNRATAIGTNAFANGNRALAFGASLWKDASSSDADESNSDPDTDALAARHTRTRATADDTIAIGTAARASANKATAVGYRAAATGKNAQAFGTLATAKGEKANAIGANARATGDNAQAFGTAAKATKQGAIAQGLGAESTGDAAIAQGVYSQATGRAATAQGLGAVSTGDAAIAQGVSSVATGNYAVAQGLAAVASGDNAQALGTAAEASGINAIAQGLAAEASGDNAQAFGKGAVAEGEDSVAQGTDAYAYGNNAQAFGKEAYALGDNSLAQGTEATADADYAIAQGNNAQARGFAAIAQGHNAQATDHSAIAQGIYATATEYGAIAQGHRATATKDSAIAQGNYATAKGFAAIAQGARATAYGEGSLALGNGATSFENASIALGLEAQAEKRFAIAVGSNAKAEGEESLALGMLAQTKGVGSTATGSHAQALAAGTTALGSRAKASKDNATAIGLFSNASAENAIAMGLQAQSSGIDAQAFGSQAVASGISSLAQGTSAKATSINAQAFGNQAQASGVNATAIGTDSQAGGHFSQALGATAEATKFGAQAFGLLASAKEHNAIAIGTGTKALGKNSQALGNSAVAEGAGSQALGAKAKSRGKRSLAAGFEAQTAKNAENALALGSNANASVANGVALGAGSVADRVAIVGATASHTTANPAQNQVYSPISGVLTLQFNNNQPDFTKERGFEQAIKDTVKGNYGAVSVGNGTNTRQITNVAAGSADSDAVNVAQLKALANTPIIIEADNNGAVPVKLGQRLPIKGAENGGITTKADLNSAGLTIGIKLDQNNGGQPAGSPLSLSDQGLKFNFDEGDFTLVDGANGVPKKLKLKAGQANAPKYFADADNDTVAPATSKNAAKAFTNEKNVLGIVGGKTGDKDSNAKNITTKINTTQNTIEVALNPDVKGLHSLQFADGQGIKIGDATTQANDPSAIAIGRGAIVDPQLGGAGLGSRSAPGFNPLASNMPTWNLSHNGKNYTIYQVVHGVAVGYESKAGPSAVSLGGRAYAKGTYSTAIGTNAYGGSEGTVALGAASFATGASGVAIGREAVSTGKFAQALGSVSSATGEKSFAVGHSATASGKRGIAIGASSAGNTLYQDQNSNNAGAHATADDTIALGSNSQATAEKAIAMGRGAQATVADGVALGAGAKADRSGFVQPNNITANAAAAFAANQVYTPISDELLGQARDAVEAYNNTIKQTVKGSKGAVSVGDNANTRQIINVAAGSADTDAVNVAQLKALAGMPMMFEADKDKDGQDVNGKVVKRKLGEQLSIKGKADSGVVTKVNATDNGIEIAVQAGNGIEVGAGGVAVKLKADAGDVKNPLTVSAEGLNLNIDDKTLEVEGNNGDKKLKVKVANQGGISTEGGQGLKVDVDGTTIQLTADGKVAAKTATLEPDTADANKGKVKLATGQNGNSLVTANTVMDAINNSGFILTAVQDGGGEATGTTNQLIKTGEKVTLDAGKNIKLAQAQGKVTIATKDDVDFNTVKVQTALQFGQDGPKIQKGGDGSTIQFTQNNGNGLVKLTGIAEGAQDNDAVSFKQLKAVQNTATAAAAKYFADTGSATSKDAAQTVADNKIGIVGGQTGTKADDKNIETKFDKDNNKIEVALKPDVKGLTSIQFADNAGVKIGDATTQATQSSAAAIGRGAQATKVGANAFGGQAQASGVNATAIGIGAQASNHFTQAFGSQAKATQFGAQALGLVATAEGRNATAIGTGAKALQRNGQAFGTNALATEAEAQAFGTDAQATEVESQAFGTGAQATKRYAQAFGSAAHATALNAMAFGHQANASAGAAIALGHQANASGDQALALGSRARATQNSGIALGAGSVADRAAITNVQTSHTTADPAQNQVYSPIAGIFSLKFANHQPSFAEQQPFENAIKNTVSGNRGAVSIGSASGTRQLTNLAAGSEDSDAVNVAQLRALANMPMFFETDTGGVVSRKLGERLPIKGKQNGGITTSTNLTTSGIDIAVQAANGIEVGANGVGVKLKADAGGVKNPLTVSAEGLNLNIDANTLAVEGENLNKKLKVKLKDNGGLKQDASGISVNIGSGLTLNPAGALTVNAQEVMRGVQLPVVYTDSRGDKVVQQNGEFFKIGPTGAPTRVKIPNNEVIASLNNGAGSTTTPMQLANVGSNININNGLGINYANRADAPNIDNIKNNAATVQDVLKVGFNLKNNQLDKDFVQAFDTINFSNGNGTVADVQTDDQGKVSTVKVNVVAKQNGGISVDAQGVSVKTDINGGLKVNQNGVGIKTADNGGLQVNQDGIGIKLNQAAPLSVDQNGLTVNVDNDTITIGEKDGKKVLKVAAGTFTQPNPNTGSVAAGNKGFVTAEQVANAINNSGFNVQVNNGAQELVKTGETLQFINGKNIEITANGKEITVATSRNPEFESVQAQAFVSKDNNGNQTLMSATGTEVSNKAGQASSYNANGMVTTDAAGNNIAITPTAITVQNANSTVTLSGNGLDNGGQRITNVAAGVNKTDAVNVSQLEAATKGASKQINNLSNQINYIDNRVTNISNQVSDLGSRVHTSEKLIGVGRDGTIDLRGLRTYNVSKQGVTQHSNLISTIRTMNEEGIKFFHTNETGNEHVVGSTNDSSAAALNSTAIGVQAKVLSDAEGSVAIGSHAQVDSHRPFSMALSAGAKVSNREIDPNNPQLMRDKALPSQELPFVPQGAQLAEVAGHGEQVIGEVSIGREAEWVENLRPDGSIDLNQPTVLVAQQTKRLSNVAAGVRPTDAANVSQVAAASNALNRSSNRGVASAMAMAMLPQEYTAGGRALAAGAAYYRGQAAIAVGGSMVSDNGKWVFKGAANINKEDIGVGFGVSYRW